MSFMAPEETIECAFADVVTCAIVWGLEGRPSRPSPHVQQGRQHFVVKGACVFHVKCEPSHSCENSSKL